MDLDESLSWFLAIFLLPLPFFLLLAALPYYTQLWRWSCLIGCIAGCLCGFTRCMALQIVFANCSSSKIQGSITFVCLCIYTLHLHPWDR